LNLGDSAALKRGGFFLSLQVYNSHMDTEKKKSLDEKIQTLIDRSSDFQDKFTYYILAVDAACIGFSVNFNKTASYNLLLIPFAIAIICWLLSFHFGIRELRITDMIIQQNHRLLVAQRFENENLVNQYLDDLKLHNDLIAVVSKRKVLFLYVGVIIFLSWYFLKIYMTC
jgi:hypothetical protein